MDRIQRAIDTSRKQTIYKAVVSNTSDIGEIAFMLNISCEATVEYLKNLITLANRRSATKQWYAFAGAHIDYAKKRIVLAIPPNELVAQTDGTLGFMFFLMGCFFGLSGLMYLIFIFSENNVSNIILAASLFGSLSAIFIFIGHKLRNREKRIKRYVRLINDEKINRVKDLANATQKSANFVRKDLQKFIKYIDSGILNAHYDSETDRIIVITRKDKSISDSATSPQEPLVF